VRQLASIAEELDTLNVILRSATEPFDTGSAAGRMMLQMLAVFAEFEHANHRRPCHQQHRATRQGRPLAETAASHSDTPVTSKSSSSPMSAPHPSSGIPRGYIEESRAGVAGDAEAIGA
jgi:Resolvase, N terminal domain